MIKQRLPKREPTSDAPPSSQEKLQAQLQSLLKQEKYRQALSEIHNAQRSCPDLVFKPSEAEIWLLRGKQEFEQNDFKQADTSLRKALQLGLGGEPHYWLAKCLLAMNRLDQRSPDSHCFWKRAACQKYYSYLLCQTVAVARRHCNR
ncbi:MAG: hypothetical protein HC772_12845 [Leptolyngbyaceae cyanobacterium CRU_2_3]|nr:hypothetical protein [Leptolyngbyaceae cyanobacterium CRU_2_3]